MLKGETSPPAHPDISSPDPEPLASFAHRNTSLPIPLRA